MTVLYWGPTQSFSWGIFEEWQGFGVSWCCGTSCFVEDALNKA